jgi:hypothetical protein
MFACIPVLSPVFGTLSAMGDFPRYPHRPMISRLPEEFSLVPKYVGLREFRFSLTAMAAPLLIAGLTLAFVAWAVRRSSAQPNAFNPNPAIVDINWMDLLVVAVYCSAVFILGTFNRRRMTAFAARVQAMDRNVCPACAYDLRSTDEMLPCPECGDTTPREIAREQWRNWFSLMGFKVHHARERSMP